MSFVYRFFLGPQTDMHFELTKSSGFIFSATFPPCVSDRLCFLAELCQTVVTQRGNFVLTHTDEFSYYIKLNFGSNSYTEWELLICPSCLVLKHKKGFFHGQCRQKEWLQQTIIQYTAMYKWSCENCFQTRKNVNLSFHTVYNSALNFTWLQLCYFTLCR